MARKPSINESTLSKMEVRKLNALRKSIGDDLGNKAFAEWYKARPVAGPKAGPVDATAEAIAQAVMGLIEDGTIKGLPRGGYNMRRGRGRVVGRRSSSSSRRCSARVFGCESFR